MIDQSDYNALKNELHVSEETLAILTNNNISLHSDDFDINDCINREIPHQDILSLIQYVHEMNSFSASEMYDVVVNNRKPIKLIFEDVKKNLILT